MKTLQTYLIAYVAAAVTMLGLDSIWLTLTADALYRPTLGELMLDQFRLGPAIAFYALYICGALIFAVRPALLSGRWTTALGSGALFGFFAYATYDLTNQATLKVWSSALSAADMAWGAVLTGLTASVAYLAASRLARPS
ncbi:MAG TPA: DUF2177 family protein [Roseiarcus sp.]|nr:DUF2177 family protein [Roseiarcus sp.]